MYCNVAEPLQRPFVKIWKCNIFLGRINKKTSSLAQDPAKTERKKKKNKGKSSGKTKKASFKKNGGKKGMLTSRRGTEVPATCEATYNDYDLTPLPREAWPCGDRPNRGKQSYTLNHGNNSGVVEVLLEKEAYYVKKLAPGYDGPVGQISWNKHGGPIAAWQIAKQRSGIRRWG